MLGVKLLKTNKFIADAAIHSPRSNSIETKFELSLNLMGFN